MSFPALATSDAAEAIVAAITMLKQERDTWRAVADSYQEAFNDQTRRLQELQDIYFATRAELENERNSNCRRQKSAEASQPVVNATDDKCDNYSSGSATIYEPSHTEVVWHPDTVSHRMEHLRVPVALSKSLDKACPFCSGQPTMQHLLDDQHQGRRTAFEAHRTVTEGLLAQLRDEMTLAWPAQLSRGSIS